MRFVRYIFLGCLATLVLSACIKEEWQDQTILEPAEGKVIIDGDVSIPATEDGSWATKAFGEANEVTIKRLYVAVFDDSDILYEVASALPGSQSEHEESFSCKPITNEEQSGVEVKAQYTTPFYVELTAEQQDVRYVHFIAVSEPNEVLEDAVRGVFDPVDEAAFVRNLVTSGGDIAYWGRQRFTQITRYTPFRHIPMIRNFAKVKVQVHENVNNFELLGFKVFDYPDKGMIAPFNNSISDYSPTSSGDQQINFNRFADYVTVLKKNSSIDPYSHLTKENGYHGFMPQLFSYVNLSSEYDTNDGPWVGSEGADYLYECSYRPDRNPFIIMKARYAASGTVSDSSPVYYYKADFVYTNDMGITEYYDILRDFQYTFNVTEVNGKGSSSVSEAANTIALNNLQGSTIARSLTNIASDNSQLSVSKTDALITSGTTFTMYMRSQITEESGTSDNTTSVAVNVTEANGGGLVVATRKGTQEIDGVSVEIDVPDITISEDAESSGPYTGWHRVEIKVNDAADLESGEVRKQTVVFKNASGLVRTLDLTLRHPFTLSVDATDVVEPGKDQSCEVAFSIPSGLTEFRFPMDFYIEQETNTLYPEARADGAAEALTVMTGKSRIPGNENKNTYYYRRTLSWEEYSAADADIRGIKTFNSYFKTLVETSATTVWVFPDEANDYFDTTDPVEHVQTNRDSFLNERKTDTELFFPFYGLQLQAGGTRTVAAITNSDGAITYSSNNASVATVDSKGQVTGRATGSATITATVTGGSYTTVSDSYTVTVVSGELCGLELVWAAEPVLVMKKTDAAPRNQIQVPKIIPVTADGYEGTISITYDVSSLGLVEVADASGDYYSKTLTEKGSTGTVTVTATAVAPDYQSGEKNFVGMTRSVSYKIQIVDTPASGTVYHRESFLEPTMGSYTIQNEWVKNFDEEDKTSEFKQYTTYNSGVGYPSRQVWYPYYNHSTGEGFGATASGYGATEAPTTYYNPDQKEDYTDYHNISYATQSELVSKDIDLSASTGGVLFSFYQAGNYFYSEENMRADASVWFSGDGGNSWTQASFDYYPSGTGWTYINASTEITDANLLTKTFRVKFVYKSQAAKMVQMTNGDGQALYYQKDEEGRLLGNKNSTRTGDFTTTEVTDYPVMIVDKNNSGRAGTWEIKNVVIKEK